MLCANSFSLPMFCFSPQQVYQPVPHKLDCCYFSDFRVLKLYFKPAVNDFTVLLFLKPLITGKGSLFDGVKCLQTVLSVQLAPLLFLAFSRLSTLPGGASAAQLPRAGQEKGVPAPMAQPQFLASSNSPRVVGTQHRNTHIVGYFSVGRLYWRRRPNHLPAVQFQHKS